MQKRSVRRKSCVLALVLSAVAASGLFPTATTATLDPKTLPLVQSGDISYIGGFRLPRNTVNGTSYSFGGRTMAFNAPSNSLYVSSRNNQVAEVSIPAPVNSTDANALPYATFLQPFADPTEGHLADVGTDGVSLAGLMVHGNRLIGTASVYYDANNTQQLSHFSHSLQLNELSFSGWTRVWDLGKTGLVSGFMSLVPSEWQPLLGGPAATGQCCIPIVTRTSWGPAAFAFNPSQIGQATTAATPLVYYNDLHPTLGQWAASSPTYGSSTEMGGLAIIGGTRTALYVGRNGMGPNCYGNGTADQSLAGTIGPDGEKYCYDPTNSSKGTHGYPYRYQLWAYDLNDFADVKAGVKQPWDVTPYGVWPLDLPTPEATVRVGGVGYDAQRQILYVSQLSADRDGYEYRPVIHALQLTVAPMLEAPAPAPASATTTALTLTANKTAPQATNAPVTFTATPAGGVGPHQYKWLVNDGNAWTPVGDWTTSSQFVWTPAVANANYFVGVWVRSAGNAADAAEVTASMPFTISAPASVPVSAVAIAANKVAPQPAGTSITWTATTSGGTAPFVYKWLIHDDVQWTAATSWTSSNTFSWTPAVANANYRVTVQVKRASNTAEEAEASAAAQLFAIGASTTTTTTTTTTTASSPVTAATITANLVAPQAAGSTITWTAAASGGTAPYVYKWLVHNDVQWAAVTGWNSTNTFAWTPTVANANYRVTVWVKRASNTADAPEVSAPAVMFAISTAPTPTTTTTTVSSPVTAAAITANMAAPQPAGSTITWTATATGGTAPYLYKWLVHNDVQWNAVTGWNSSNTFAWTPALANANYRVTVWVKRASNTADAPEVSAPAVMFAVSTATAPITTVTTVSAPVTAATIVADKVGPQPVGSTITWTAAASGGTAPYVYKWLVHNDVNWNAVTGWTSSNTFAWTPTTANANYRVTVWVKRASNTADAPEVSAPAVMFPIQ